MREELIQEINKTSASADLKQKSIASIKKSWKISEKKNQYSSGMSRIGGYPDLSVNVEYPVSNECFFEFVCQINLEGLNTSETLLPKSGLLSFFIWDDFKPSNTPNRVIYQPNSFGLTLKKPLPKMKSKCESFEGRNESSFLELDLVESISLDQNLLDELVETTASESLERFYTTDQLYGHPATWRVSDSSWWAHLGKNRFDSLGYITSDSQIDILVKENRNIYQFLSEKLDKMIGEKEETLSKYDNSLHIYSYWEKDLENMLYTRDNLKDFSNSILDHKQESKNWIHLLGLSSSYDAHVRFGDGKMEFYIHKSDLEKLDFSNVYCQIYN